MAGQTRLLVEGGDDEHVLKHICGAHQVPHLSEIKALEGFPNILNSIVTQLRFADEGDIIGVIVDADTNLTNRWQSLRSRFIEAGYQNVPVQPLPSGTVLEPPSESILPRAGIWIMPDNSNKGNLEDFLSFLVPQPNKLLEHATACVEAVPTRLFGKGDELKATLHTWLAWQKEPGRPYGTAITARFLDPNVPEVHVLVSWLRELFR